MFSSCSMKAWLRTLLKFCLWCAGIICSLLLVTFLLIHVPGVRVGIVLYAVETLNSGSSDTSIELDNLQSLSLSDWRFSQLKVKQKNKDWLMVSDFHFKMNVAELWGKNIDIGLLKAGSINYYHLPSSEGPEEDAVSISENGDFNFSFPWSVVVNKFRVDQLTLDLSRLNSLPPKLDLPSYRINGQIKAFTDEVPLYVDLSVSNSEEGSNYSTSLSITTEVDSNNQAELIGNFRESASGLLGGLIRYPQDQPIAVSFNLQASTNSSGYHFELSSFETTLLEFPLVLRATLDAGRDFSSFQLSKGVLHTEGSVHEFFGAIGKTELNMDVTLNEFPLKILSYWVPEVSGGQVSAKSQITGSFTSPIIASELMGTAELNAQGVEATLSVDAKVEYNSEVLTIGRLSVSSNNIASTDIALTPSSMMLDAQGAWQISKEKIDMDLTVKDLNSQIVNTFLVVASSPLPKELFFNVSKLHLKLEGSTADQFSNTNIELLAQAAGTYAEMPIVLDAKVSGTSLLAKIESVQLQSEEAKILLQGDLDLKGNGNTIELEVVKFPFSQLVKAGVAMPKGLKGSVNGKVKVFKSFLAPEAEIALDADLAYPLQASDGNAVVEKAKLTVSGVWKDHLLRVSSFKLVNASNQLLLEADGQFLIGNTLPEAHVNVQAVDFPMSLIASYGWPDSKGVMNLSVEASSQSAKKMDGSWFKTFVLDVNLIYQTEYLNLGTDEKVGVSLDLSLAKSQGTKTSEGPLWILQSNISKTSKSNSNSVEGFTLTVPQAEIVSAMSNGKVIPNAHVAGSMDLSFFDFMIPDTQKLQGVLNLDLDVSGDFSSPDLFGHLSLMEADYSNADIGMFLNDIVFQTDFNGKRATLSSASVKDNFNGDFKVDGYMDWKKEGDVHLTIESNHFELLSHKYVEGKITSKMNLTGNLKKLLLAGNIVISPFSASIAGSTGPSIPEISIELSEQDKKGKKSFFQPPELILDLAAKVEKQAFIHGRGLEAELAGNIRLKGPVDKLKYEGGFNVVRGRVDVFGKRFDLDKGEIGFANQDVVLYVVGLYEEDDTEVKVEVSGIGDDIKIELSSTPTMPEDELISWLIFGKSVAEMTPLQAIQLAGTIQKLKGGGGGIVGNTRNKLGIDTLSVNAEDTDNGTEVTFGAGKYLTERVYLEIERSSDPAYPWQAHISIDLTSSIKVETTSGSADGDSAELLWTHNY